MIFLSKMSRKKKNKRRIKIIIRILNLMLIFVLGGIVYSFGVATYENIQVDVDIAAFKARATTEIEVNFEYRAGVFQQRVYHIVPRETSYELEDTRSVFNDETYTDLGQTGDIFVTQDSPFPTVFGFHQFMSYYFGGHAAFKSSSNTFYEATGMANDFSDILTAIRADGYAESASRITASESPNNYWLYPTYRSPNVADYEVYGPYYRNEFVGLRVKGVTDSQLVDLENFGDEVIYNAYYNYLFFLDMKDKYYCTDLVSRAYQSIMVPTEDQKEYSKVLNDDGFITSVNDLILSNDTYMICYVEVIDEVVHIYYLEDI